MDNGLVTRTKLFADQGLDFEEESQTMAEEREFLEALELAKAEETDGQNAVE